MPSTALPTAPIDRLHLGQAVPSPDAPDVARVVVLDAGLDPSVEARSVSRGAASGYGAVVGLVEAIRAGVVGIGIAGGTESASDRPVTLSRPLARALADASATEGIADRVRVLAGLRPRDLAPAPTDLREPSTGRLPGERAEHLARAHGITRKEQDDLAVRSHREAVRAWSEGALAEQVFTVHVPPDYEVALSTDPSVHDAPGPRGVRSLTPAHDRRYGTITSGNASVVADGAAALLALREDRARDLGLRPLAVVRSHASVAFDPMDPSIPGPALAIPAALERAGVELADLHLIDVHEASAAEVLATVSCLGSEAWARDHLGRSTAVGEIDVDRLNVGGGAIAFGDPLGASGVRQMVQTVAELERRGGGLGLCATGGVDGIGAALILEVEP